MNENENEITRFCRACGDPIPPYKGRGRVPEWCSTGCRSYAFRERRRAAELRIYAKRLNELADELKADPTITGRGTPEAQRAHAASTRAMADEIEAKFGRGDPVSG